MEAASDAPCLRTDDLEIRPAEFTAIAGDRPLNLTARELELLTALVEREGRIVSREEQPWPPAAFTSLSHSGDKSATD